MNSADNKVSNPRFQAIFLGVALLWSLLILTLAGWDYWESYCATLDTARAAARESYSKDLVYRQWATMLGGVYAPITPETPPNPYLANIPERDISTPSGKKLTLINPAYMNRQVYALGKKEYGVLGHITSLKPIRPENAPDAWERMALQALAGGQKEVGSLESIGNVTYFRLMRPLFTETGCLKCHARQGYKLGDIRGGISVSIPWGPFHKALGEQLHVIILAYGLIWLMGISGIYLGKNRLQNYLSERNRAEQQREQFYKFFQTSADLMCIADPNGAFLKTNPSCTETLGYSEAELIAQPFVEFIVPEDKQATLEEMARQQQRGASLNFENRYLCKDGSVKWLSWRAIYNKDEGITYATARDVTEQKRAEAALQASESHIKSISNNFNAGMIYQVVINPDGARKFTYLSDSVRQLYGISPAEGMADATLIYSRIHEDDIEVLRKAEEDAAKTLSNFKTEVRMKDPSGAIRWSSFASTPKRREDGSTCFDGIELITTERKQAEQVMEQNEARLREAQRIAHLGNWEYNLLTKKLSWSDEIYRILELDPQTSDASHDAYLAAIHPEDRDAVKTAYRQSLKNHKPYEIIHRLLMPDGRIKYVKEHCATYDSPDGKPLRTVGIVLDITELKQMEEQLRQSQKIEAIGQLAGGVAHDFNNMLGVILGHVEMALDKVEPYQPLYADLQEIRKAAERSANLTTQLLTFARKQPASPKVIDLNETVEGALKMLRRLIGEDIHLNWLPDTALWLTKVDPSQIDQILANLCVNARDAISGVGKVTIETGNISFDAAYCADHAGFILGEYVLLAVSDDGCGMGKEVIGKLFEPFFTTKEMGKGTGLGLATVYGIVKQNGGFINVYSEPAHGTTFKVYLPRYTGQADQILTKETPEPILRGQETILVVEDEPALLELSKLVLEQQGYRVLSAGTPDQAIHLAEEYAQDIQLLITDVIMPEMNGHDLAKKMHRFYPNLKVLFMSGYTPNVIAHHGVLDEEVYFIQKPFSRKALAAKVREALDRKI